MKTATNTFSILGIFACCLALSASAMAVDFTSAETARLQSGRVVRKPLPESRQHGFFGGSGYAMVDASPEIIWAAINDWASYQTIFPRTVGVRELSHATNRSLVQMELGYKLMSVEYHLDIQRNASKDRISFSLREDLPHDIQAVKGSWTLIPQADGRTLVVYSVKIQVPRIVTAFLGPRMEKELEDSLIGLPRYIKKWVEGPAGNRYRKLTAQK